MWQTCAGSSATVPCSAPETAPSLRAQVDLCHGPHLPNTGLLRASAVAAMNRAYWRANVNQEPLQARPRPRTLLSGRPDPREPWPRRQMR